MKPKTITHSPSAMLHSSGGSKSKKTTSLGDQLNQRQFGASNSTKGFGNIGASAFGGQRK